jgi:protein TonB
LDEANFYAMVREKVEKEGTCHFPSKGRKKLYGNLVISIPISENGAIHQKTGGAKIERSSGNQYLDAAALRIVNSSAPFGPIPESQRKAGYENVWTVVAYFDFKRVEEDDSPIDCAK